MSFPLLIRQRDLSEVSRQERDVHLANRLRETSERFSWTKPLSSLCGLFQSGRDGRRFATALRGRAHDTDWCIRPCEVSCQGVSGEPKLPERLMSRTAGGALPR